MNSPHFGCRGHLLFFAVVSICTTLVWTKLDSLQKSLLEVRIPTAKVGDQSEPGDGPGGQDFPTPIGAPNHRLSGRVAIVPEWEPVGYVALALPRARILDGPYMKLMGDLAQTCLELPDVRLLVLVEERGVQARSTFDALVRSRSMASDRIDFLEVKELDSVWLRDFGPIFTRRDKESQIIVNDVLYRDIRLGLDQAMLFGNAPTLRPSDDLVPMYFATFLNLPFIRHDFAMNGGDMYANGEGQLFTSEETIHLNSGDRESLDREFRDCLGIQAAGVHYLRPLPGPTVKHLDMFFKLVDDRTCLLGDYRATESLEEVAVLQRAAQIAMDHNAQLLESLGMRVVRVPMPDIHRLSKWEYYGRVLTTAERDEFVVQLAKTAEIPPEEQIAKLEVESVYCYRSCVNGLFLQSKGNGGGNSHRMAVVPSYPSVESSDFHSQVDSAYRVAYGADLEVRFVNAEALAHSNGSLRCVVATVPQAALQSPRNREVRSR